MAFDGPKTDASDEESALGDLLCFSIYSAEHAFSQLYRPLLAELGLTYPQYLVLLLLWQRDGRTVGELGRALRLQSNTLTPMLKRLESLGLIGRRRDPADERVVRVDLTEAGRALRARSIDIPECVAAATGLSADELRYATDLVNRLRDHVTAYAVDLDRPEGSR
ncbi:MarR family transcriptional regulator [Acuticoccus sp. M5D2P5]|uniref:MarR family winged helix-turn-helix transcriptional regulator n=1 Tax=Acuticoccus kalidii TaxID=2910977 RepID=UPI001F1F7B9D|nr:MarR family transcriptional regulator [Acuticoccus kalidii]MCF3933088.1 MarR family transcriptional regulator [Acuticoccus kalidii]